MGLEATLERLSAALHGERVRFALIGGLALAARGALRATGDIDLLVDAEDSERLDALMEALGYERRYRSEDVAQYRAASAELSDVDFLFARRPYARAMLERARDEELGLGLSLRVVEAEDLIGLKVQSSSNDPRRRTLDMADVERLLEASAERLDLGRIREYFEIFERGAELDEMLARLRSAT